MRGLKREPKGNIIAESLPEIVPGRFCEDSNKGTDLPEIFLQKNLGQRAFARTRADGPPVTDPPARPTCTWEELLTIIRQAVYEISQRVHGLTNRGRNCRLTGIYRSLRRWQRCIHTHECRHQCASPIANKVRSAHTHPVTNARFETYGGSANTHLVTNARL